MGDISDNDMGGEVGAALAGALDPRIMTNLIMKPGPPTCVFTMTKPDGVMIRHLRCEIPRMFIGHAQIMITQFPTTGTLEGKWKMDAKMFVPHANLFKHVFHFTCYQEPTGQRWVTLEICSGCLAGGELHDYRDENAGQ